MLSPAGAVIAAALALPATAAGEGTAYSTFHPVVNIRDSGPPANRYDFVFAGDGYTEDTDWRARALATEIAAYLVTRAQDKPERGKCRAGPAGCRIDTEPYVRYRRFLNFHRIRTYSKAYFDAGDFDDNGNLLSADRDLRRDSIFGLTVGFPQAVEATAQDSADGAGLAPDGRGWIAEAPIGLALPPWAQASNVHHLPGEHFAHEGGHANHDLLDEYHLPGSGTYPPIYGEPKTWNVTTDETCGKWEQWLGYVDMRILPATGEPMGPIGCHEGAGKFERGAYRPAPGRGSSRMWRDNPFHRVSMEKVIHDIYGAVRPLDGYRDNETQITNPAFLWVDEVDPAVIKVDWTIVDAQGDGVGSIEDGGGTLDVGQEFNVLGLEAGEYRITAHAYDEAIEYAYTESSPDGRDIGDLDTLDIVRKREVIERMQQDVEWTIKIGDAERSDDHAGIQVLPGQRFTVDRASGQGAVVGWVRAAAPDGHRFVLPGGHEWLSIDAHTGRLEVADPVALENQSPGAVQLPVRVSAEVGRRAVTVDGAVTIDVNDARLDMIDEFDDGTVGGNAGANGRGFAVPVATLGKAVEDAGRLVLELPTALPVRGRVVTISKDSFDFTMEDHVEVTWEVLPADSPAHECHLLLVPARAPLDTELARGNVRAWNVAVHPPDFGLHVDVCGANGAVLVSTPLEAVPRYRTLAQWNWEDHGVDRSSPLAIVLRGNRHGYELEAGGEVVAEGKWPPELDEPPGLFQIREPWQHRTVRVGALLRGRGAATLALERISVKPAPGERPLPNLSVEIGKPLSLDLDDYFTGGESLEFAVTGLPPGVGYSPAGGVSGAPVQSGDYEVNVQAGDGTVASFRVTVELPAFTQPARFHGPPVRIESPGHEPAAGGNRPPELVRPLPVLSAKRHRRVVIDLDAYFADRDGDRLRYVTGGNAPASFRVRRAGRLSGFMPREGVTFTVTARDPSGATAQATLRLVPDGR